MENVIVLERSLEEILVKLEKPMNEEDCNPEKELKIALSKNMKKSRIKFYRPEPYPLAKGLLIGF